MRKLLLAVTVIVCAFSASTAASAVTAPAKQQCKVAQVTAVPVAQTVTDAGGKTRTEHFLRVLPFVSCGNSRSVLEFAWIFPGGFDRRFHGEIPLQRANSVVPVTLIVSGAGVRSGYCSFRANGPPKLPFPRYLYSCN